MKEDYLQKLREEKGFSQRRLAHVVGISRGRLRRLEGGEMESITYRELKEICLALGLKPEEFFQRDAPDGSQPVLRRAGESAFKIKVSGAGYELLSLLPSSEDLFAGKIHAVLHRKWKTRVKGRDFYDFVWYVARGIPVRLIHLEARLRQTQGWTATKPLQKTDLLKLLQEKFNSLNVEAAQKDVLPFLKDPASVEVWSKDFFSELLPKLQVT